MAVGEQLPAFHYFDVGNGYTGNVGERRYKIETDKGERKLRVYLYSGKLCFELAEIEEQAEFDLSSEGLEECISWMEEHM